MSIASVSSSFVLHVLVLSTLGLALACFIGQFILPFLRARREFGRAARALTVLKGAGERIDTDRIVKPGDISKASTHPDMRCPG